MHSYLSVVLVELAVKVMNLDMGIFILPTSQELIGVSDKQRGLEGRKIIGCLVVGEPGNLGMVIRVL